ncbi:MAG: cytochrome c biogenesis protein CcsA [Crocinitomicaceae bacterium]
MDKFANQFFSMRMMAIAMIIFFVAIGGATLLESAYDTQTSKMYVYNATWFNLLLVYLSMNLIANIIRHRMVQTKKWGSLLFHVSFLVILIGAAITRFVSFEGVMLIPEGGTSDFLYSSQTHVSYRITDKKVQLTNDLPVYLSELDWWNGFDETETLTKEFGALKGKEVDIEYVGFKKNMIDSMVTNDSIKESAIELVYLGESQFIAQNGFLDLGGISFSFDKKNAMPGVELFKNGNKYQMKVAIPGGTSLPMSTLRAADRTTGVPDSLYQPIPSDTIVPLEMSTLYKVGETQFVFKGVKKNTKMIRVQSEVKDEGLDDVVVKVSFGGKSKTVTLTGGNVKNPLPTGFELNGLFFDMTYGPKKIDIPFKVGCDDFRLETYPGSSVASSYESDLSIIDEANNYNKEQTVFMNHIMDYQGYRFFQSSYFPDETGTILSVNYDRLGTNVTYIGYLLMTIGMIVSLFMKKGRVRDLIRKLVKNHDRKVKLQQGTLALAMLFSVSVFGQTHTGEDHSDHDHSQHDHSGHDHAAMDSANANDSNGQVQRPEPVLIHRVMSEEVSDEMAGLLLFNVRERIVPFQTFASKLLRKIHRSDKYEDYDAIQAVVSMHMYPDYWVRQDVIYIDSKGGIRDRFDGRSHVSFIDLMDTTTGQFLFLKEYEKAHRKREVERNEFEKRLLKIAERFQVFNDITLWRFMKIVPSKTDASGKWFVPLSTELAGADSTGSRLALRFFTAVNQAAVSNSDTEAMSFLKDFKSYQRKVAGDACPSIEKVEMEVRYNKMNIVHNVWLLYFSLGFILLIVAFIGLFAVKTEKGRKRMKFVVVPLVLLLGVTFLYHGYGVYLRAMITGYAPWANGYEAMVFIALVIMALGFTIVKRYPVVTAAAAILAFLVLFVSEMNLLDPEITPMQPVLKSYWLMIHVAIITGSYAPLGISCILALLVLNLYIFRNKGNADRVNLAINDLTYITEIFMIVGLFMLTVGTFLGGIWANESWGRYWGWDPKETWALVAVLVYAVILHLRFIPGLNGKFVFNAVAFWGYTSILFTFFGVNFYLVGLHSYAQGDGLGEFPTWIILTALFFAAFTGFAAYRNWSFKKKLKQEDVEI